MHHIYRSDFCSEQGYDLTVIYLNKVARKPAGGTSQGKVFKDTYPKNTQWKRFVAKAGLPARFRFHDIRHTFATWLSQSGVERKTVQDLAGWNSSSMLDNYVHLPSSHLAAASEGLSQLFRAQIGHKEQIRQLEKVA